MTPLSFAQRRLWFLHEMSGLPFPDHDAPLTGYLEAVAADLLSVAP